MTPVEQASIKFWLRVIAGISLIALLFLVVTVRGDDATALAAVFVGGLLADVFGETFLGRVEGVTINMKRRKEDDSDA